MKLKLFYFFALLHYSLSVNAQEKISVNGGTSYIATPVWTFFCEDYAYAGELKVQIAKTDKGGILKLSTSVSNNKLNIGERVYLILKDGSYIYCSDKGTRTNTENETSSFFNLTVAEMNKLKTFSIANIRFKIIGKKTIFSSQTGYFTANNKKQFFDPADKSVNSFETNIAIYSLYK